MPLVALFDSMSFLFAVAGLVLLAAGWKRIIGPEIRILLAALFGFTLFYAFCMWVEWVGISRALEPYEDYTGALMPMLWAFVFYAYIQQGMTHELQKSEENLRVTLDSIGDGVIAATREGRISRMNPMAEKLTGWKLAETKGRPLVEVFRILDARTREPVLKEVTTLLQNGQQVRATHHALLISRDGTEYHAAYASAPIQNAEGETIGIVLVFRDETREYRLHEQIAENEKRMELTLKGADLATWDWHVKTGELVMNERWAEMLGYAPHEPRPHVSTWKERVHPDDLPAVLETLHAHLEGKTAFYETEHRLRHKDGRWVWVLDRGRVIERDAGGHPVRACGTHLDISERRQSEAQLRQMQKIEAVGRLAGGVAHDLNNLLAPILGYGELLAADPGLDDRQRESINEIQYAGLRARGLVRQLLAFCRRQPLEVQPVNVNETLENFEKLLRRTISEDIDIRVITSAAFRPVIADTSQIEQIIMNLAVNAADAMPDGGTLTIETAVAELDQDHAVIWPPEAASGPYVVLAVSDTGCGMSKDIREHVFEPFFSTKGEHGTGLGLATVYGIVKQHRGNISLYSEAGQGTTFKIYLPASEDAAVRPASAAASQQNLQGRETILLAEDNEQVRHLARTILERLGYTVRTAKDGAEALAVLAAQENPVHLLLTDVVMPGMSGRDLYAKAVRKQQDLKVVYMSGYADNVLVHRGVRGEEVPFVQKPFSIGELASKIREVLDKRD